LTMAHRQHTSGFAWIPCRWILYRTVDRWFLNDYFDCADFSITVSWPPHSCYIYCGNQLAACRLSF
jgi:hypothetical protein